MRPRRAASAALLAMSVALPAAAHSPCDPTDDDRAEADRAIGHVVQARDHLDREINEMERAVIEALRLQTGQLAGYQAESTQTITRALDAKMGLEAQLAREVREVEATLEHRPSRSACAVATGAAGLAGSRAAADAWVASGTAAETGRLVHDGAVVATPSAAADTAARYATLLSTWCADGRSPGAGGTCSGSDELHAADITAAALYDRDTLATEVELAAAADLGRNLAAPVLRDPQRLAAVSTAAEQRLVLLERAADARTALALDHWTRARALRAPGVDLGDWAAAIGGDADRTGPVSRYELLSLLARGRAEDPAWYAGLEAMGVPGLLREIATLLAIDLTLDWERYRLAERGTGLDAAALAHDVERAR